MSDAIKTTHDEILAVVRAERDAIAKMLIATRADRDYWRERAGRAEDIIYHMDENLPTTMDRSIHMNNVANKLEKIEGARAAWLAAKAKGEAEVKA